MGVIYIVRHGQASTAAYDTDVADDVPTGLTELGRHQAEHAGVALSRRIGHVDAAFCGDLPRQRETLDLVLAQLPDSPVPTVDERWDEYRIADVLSGVDVPSSTDTRGYQEVLDAALDRWIGGGEGAGESFADFTGRAADALTQAATAAGSGKTVVVASSSGTIAAVVAALWGMPPQSWQSLARMMVNTAITKLIVGGAGVHVASVAEHAHVETAGLMTYR
ncbi:histidine phosphatase family protein [Gordonia jinhuaensis]|uniref:Phosphoglycerate mutase n=1 Tax=Gordonia jinhuaensis TaxID=1517702 RepID=A0A916T507_9ACTN|nr:histidine phosphatase family protein [Gordonia jinhuaensis]GGB28556.1 phosphoglycerate mutase [Gordonia jinhuaensis]